MMIAFHDSLKAKIEAEIIRLAGEVVFSPSTGTDAYGDYRQRCGLIQGLQAALDISDILEDNLLKG